MHEQAYRVGRRMVVVRGGAKQDRCAVDTGDVWEAERRRVMVFGVQLPSIPEEFFVFSSTGMLISGY